MKKMIWGAIILLLFMTTEAFALRCGNKLVDIGDRKIEVLEKCGNPLFVENWQEEVIVYRGRLERQIRRLSNIDIEEWTYNFGANRFIYFLRFVNGRLNRIEEGQVGSNRLIPSLPQPDCGQRVEIGDRRIDVLRKCGKPVTTEKREDLRVTTSPTQEQNVFADRVSQVDIEEWTYNFGPTHFLLFIRLQRGRVTSMEFGDYGF
jgi:hypothetical protein